MNTFLPHLEILPAPQQRQWPELAAIPRDFVLYGGTGIALRLAHRRSLDFDFFSTNGFAPTDLQRSIPWVAKARRLQSKPNTLTVVMDCGVPVKVSFFGGLALGRVGEPDLTPDAVFWPACSTLVSACRRRWARRGRSTARCSTP